MGQNTFVSRENGYWLNDCGSVPDGVTFPPAQYADWLLRQKNVLCNM
jgi:hypothetical protein